MFSPLYYQTLDPKAEKFRNEHAGNGAKQKGRKFSTVLQANSRQLKVNAVRSNVQCILLPFYSSTEAAKTTYFDPSQFKVLFATISYRKNIVLALAKRVLRSELEWENSFKVYTVSLTIKLLNFASVTCVG